MKIAMKLLCLVLLFFVCMPILAQNSGQGKQAAQVPILTYHNVVSGLTGDEPFDTVTIDTLVRHFRWLQANGYTPISMEEFEAASDGNGTLPSKPILLTFDDGYSSFYEYVYPLLKSYKWHALQAVITSKIDDSANPSKKYLSSSQIREMAASGLVSFASHTHDLHKGVPANAWGNLQPSAVTRIWADNQVEQDSTWERRIAADLKASAQTLREVLGTAPKYLVWPYGRYNNKLTKVGESIGYTFQFTLDAGVSDVVSDRLSLNRYLVGINDSEGTLRKFLETAHTGASHIIPIKAAVAVLAETETSPKEERLSALIENLRKTKGNTVILNPFKIEQGKVVATTYPSSILPLTSMYANRVAAAVYNKTGSAILLGVYLAPQRYAGLNEDAILQLIEEAAKAIPISGLVVEDPDDVAYAYILKALARVALWRQAPRLEVKINMN